MNLDIGYARLIIATAEKNGVLRNQLAYLLATAFWETNRTMKPVREAYWLSEEWRKEHLRYWPWYGRGFVQITWERNYIKMGKRLGLDLTSSPDVVLEPAVAAKILVIGAKEGLFTGKKLSDYITLQKSDFLRARKIINGMDRAFEIAEIAKAYDAALIADGYGFDIPSEEPTGFMAALLKGLFK